MRIITLVHNYFSYFFLLLFSLGNYTGYSQCPTVTNPTQTFCDSQAPKIDDLEPKITTGIRWFSKETGTGTGVIEYTTGASLVDNAIYYADYNTGSCGTRSSVLVKIYAKPSGPSAITLCQGTVADLMPYSASGNYGGQIKWYDALNGGNLYNSNDILDNNKTYYASQVNPLTGCESNRKDIFVTMPIAPTPTGNAIQDFCASSSPRVQNLVANGPGILWYDSLGNVLDPTEPLVNGYYYAESNQGPCSSAIRLEVLVNLKVLSISNIEVVYNCGGNIPGNSVTVTVNTASVGNVQYSIDGSTYQASNVFTNLVAGIYIISVKHNGSGCTKTLNVIIKPKTPVTASIGSIVNATCRGSATGSITVTATGGTTPLQYAISPGYVYQSGNVFNNLTAGAYDIKIKDAIGCEVLLSNNIITEPTAIVVSLTSVQQEMCSGYNDGSITVSIIGGKAPYATSLDGVTFVSGQANTFTNLKGGQIYTVYVKDGNNCTPYPRFSYTLKPAVDLQLNLTSSVQCTGNVPSHTITASVNPSLVSTDVAYSLDGANYQTGNVFSGLTSGTHTVLAKHVNGCTETLTMTIEPITPVTASIESIVNATCVGSDTGSITVAATGGTLSLQYAISPGYVYQSDNLFNNLTGGTYDIKVRDAIGCEVLLVNNSITATVITNPSASAQTFFSSATVLDLVATGSNLQWYDVATEGTALTSNVVLETGTYYVSQTENGCESERVAVSVTIVDLYTVIPDANFEQALIDLGYDTVLDGKVLTSSVNGITTLDVSNKNISDLTGIEAFVSLQMLNCSSNNLTTLDVSKLTELQSLNCSSNQLTVLLFSDETVVEQKKLNNASGLTLLHTLNCSNNQLTALDISKLIALENFDCSANTSLSCITVNDESAASSNATWFTDATSSYSTSCSKLSVETPSLNTLIITCYPNPYKNDFMINVVTESQELLKIKVYDMLGKLLEQREAIPSDISKQRIGENYPTGIYNIVINQAEELKTLRVIKQ